MKHRSHPLGIPGWAGGGVLSQGNARQQQRTAVTPLDRWLARRLAAFIGKPPIAFALWDGEDAIRPEGAVSGRIRFGDRRALVESMVSPELGFGDAYSAGRIQIEGELIEVLHGCFANVAFGASPFKRKLLGRLPRPSRNSQSGSKHNIHHHYDLGNSFYRLWLDERMVYTCAYFESAEATLEQAQVAKMDHVCRKLRLRPGQRVVEAGCGWGSLALHMARRFGVSVRAFNISREQVEFARRACRDEGLDGRVEFVEDDYRNIDGRYDAFVSIGMLEHVGVENYLELGQVIKRSLAPGGLGLIHSVGRARPSPPNAWLERRIFPGSYPPSLSEMMTILEPADLAVLDVENLRLHYARTLRIWLERFDTVAERVRAMYDEEFVRAWRLYLGGCSAAFLASTIQLYQVLFSHARANEIPWTRKDIYSS